jgi:hypothetical protein
MPTKHRRHRNSKEQSERIEALKQRARKLVRGQMIAWELEKLPPDVRERLFERAMDHENAPLTTNFQQLIDIGLELPEPDALNDEEVTSKLWEVIEVLAEIGVFISCTDHLSDRELYAELWNRVLRDEVPDLPYFPGSATHVDLLGTGSDAHTYMYLKYYADEDWREKWLADFPDYELPAHEDPPYDRDRLLPQPDYQAMLGK